MPNSVKPLYIQKAFFSLRHFLPVLLEAFEFATVGLFMSSLKEIKSAQKSVLNQQQVILELEALVKDIERCEKTIVTLKSELESVNQTHQGRRTTREDIAYLTDLLKCANKKLAWEKQMSSLQKRTPLLLEKMSALINDPKNPPVEQVRDGVLRSLQGVQTAMERLQTVNVD